MTNFSASEAHAKQIKRDTITLIKPFKRWWLTRKIIKGSRATMLILKKISHPAARP